MVIENVPKRKEVTYVYCIDGTGRVDLSVGSYHNHHQPPEGIDHAEVQANIEKGIAAMEKAKIARETYDREHPDDPAI